MSAVVQPLLKKIAQLTGLSYITLLAGCPPKPGQSRCHIAAVHFRETKDRVPKNFGQWDIPGFRVVLDQFGKFLKYVQCKQYIQCDSRSLVLTAN
jgi:hypothetical protein